MKSVARNAHTRYVIYCLRTWMPTAAVVLLWGALATPLFLWAARSGSGAAALFAVATALGWCSGGRAAALWMRSADHRRSSVSMAGSRPRRIALVFCVCDDMDAEALRESADQDIPVDVVVLDDSLDAAVRARIDVLARLHCWNVVRRRGRAGFKAGNLNAGLASLRGKYDAYLVCDSDVVLARDTARICAEALRDPRVAVAQAAPAASVGRSRFARYFGPLLATHLTVTRRGRAARGVTAFLGRGALVRAAAIEEVGGFPEAVAEDLAMTVALRRRGWRIVDVDAGFTEDYPVDYAAFRTQVRKTAEGAVELLRRPSWMRGLPMRERIDLLLETSLLPLTAVAGATTLVCGAALAGAGTPPPGWALAVSAVGAALPLLPEAVRRAQRRGPAGGVAFTVVAGALYASTTFVVLSAVLRTALGRRATFWITPKQAARRALLPTISMLGDELMLVPALAAAAVLVSGSGLALAGPAGPALCAVLFAAGMLRRHASPVRTERAFATRRTPVAPPPRALAT